jgi:hypothetical protein
MPMIFYEKDEAERLLKNGFTSFMSFQDLALLARYFKYLGKNNTQIRKSLIAFCQKYNSDFNEILARNKIENAILNSQKFSLRLKMDVNITQSELDTIKKNNYKIQRILFILLVIAKYFKYNNTSIKQKEPTKYDANFYVSEKFTTIIKMANINVSKKERHALSLALTKSGLVTPTLVGSLQINFVDDNSPVVIVVTDMNNIISFLPFFCANCGKEIEEKAKRHDFCDECYKGKRKEDIKNNVQHYRKKNV